MNSAAAQHAIIDPLVEPEPSDDTGLNSHFDSTFAPRQNITPPLSAGIKAPSVDIRQQNTGSSVDTNPYRRARAESAAKNGSIVSHGEVTPQRRQEYPSPPNSASPRRQQFSNHRAEAFSSMNEGGRPRRSSQPPVYNQTNTFNAPPNQSSLNRSGSLRERYPGDQSHRPLDILRKDTKTAHRAHHLRKKNFQGADIIDRLDDSTFKYHHEGPYDAANISRNTDWSHSPIAAVHDSNEEALRATPKERIIDAVTKHRPLEGVANLPPGVPDKLGRVLDYEEGSDLQREPGGDLARWGGVTYLPGDLKGRGEPSFSADKASKDHHELGESGIEMTSRHHHSTSSPSEDVRLESPFDDRNGIGRSNTTGKSVGGSLKKRFGSLRRRKVDS